MAVVLMMSATSAIADPGDVPATAPAADAASGIEVAPPEAHHPISNTLLAVPRFIAFVLLRGPRYAAAGVDSRLEAKSPDVGGRTVAGGGGWRMGAEVTGETELGASLALRIGHTLGTDGSIDLSGGVLGWRGQSGALRVVAGDFTVARLQPSVTIDAGNDLKRIAGEAVYEANEVGITPTLSSRIGPFRFTLGARVDRIENATLVAMTIGSGETERGISEEIAVVYDDRRRTHPWVNEVTYSTGFYVRAAASYLRGDASRSGAYSTGRGSFEALRLFDLFHGDRVLTLGVRGEAVTDDSVPFDRLPSLGGADRMRAFARDELRGRRLGFAELQYEWALGADSRAYVFTEAGGAASTVHVDYGVGVRILTGSSTSLRAQAAASDDGDFGCFLQLGAL